MADNHVRGYYMSANIVLRHRFQGPTTYPPRPTRGLLVSSADSTAKRDGHGGNLVNRD